MKFFLALKQIAFATKLFAAAGFTGFNAAMEANDENALKAHLEKAAPAKTIEPTEEELTMLVTEELRARFGFEASVDPFAIISSVTAQNLSFHAVLKDAGVKVANDAKPEAIATALKSRISTAASEELAKHGLKAFPEQEVTADPTKVAAKIDPKLTGLARVTAAFKAEKKH
jgi:hypothetical protein